MLPTDFLHANSWGMAATQSSDHYRDLDALRGIMALLVVAFHFGVVSRLERVNGTMPAEPAFGVAVDFFFVLSGLVLARSYTNRPRPIAVRMVERIFRLVPVHAVMMLTVLPLLLIRMQQQASAQAAAATFGGFVAELAGVYIYLFPTFPSWNLPDWSMQVELFVPVVLAGLLPAAWRIGSHAILALIAVLIVLQGWLCYEHAFGIANALKIDHFLLLRGVVGLALGGLVYVALERGLVRVPATRLFLPAATGLFVMTMVLCPWIPVLGWFMPLIIVTIVAFGTRSNSLLARQPFGWLAEHSFTIYMVHMPLAMYKQRLMPMLGEGLMPKVFLLALVFVGAALLTRYVEKPGMAWGKRLLRERMPGPSGAVKPHA